MFVIFQKGHVPFLKKEQLSGFVTRRVKYYIGMLRLTIQKIVIIISSEFRVVAFELRTACVVLLTNVSTFCVFQRQSTMKFADCYVPYYITQCLHVFM